jgi:CheY-like chemotaxis protein
MGGQWEVRSAVGRGSMFSFTLPLEACEKAEAASALPAGVRVFVADPQPLSRRILSETLTDWKIDHRVAGSLDEMADVLATEREPFDICLADHRFWESNAMELKRFLSREALWQSKLLVLAPLGLGGDPRRYPDGRFAGWVTKPVRHAQLAAALEAAYRSRIGVAMSPPVHSFEIVGTARPS